MTFWKTTTRRAGTWGVAAKAVFATRLSAVCGEAGAETCRAAAAGAILFGFAAAGLGARGGFSTFRVDAAAAGATVSVGWGYQWIGFAIAGAVLGAVTGAAATLAARRWLVPRRAAAALLAVGAFGGILSGATWGTAVARERVVEVRAQPTNAAPLRAGIGPSVSVVNGPIRLSGSVVRDVNLPLLAFMVVGGTLVGALVARGLPESLPLARRDDEGAVRDHLGRPAAAPRGDAGAFPVA